MMWTQKGSWRLRGILGLALCALCTLSAWVGYEYGQTAGWVRGYNDRLAFSKKAGVLTDETGTGRVVLQNPTVENQSESGVTVHVVRRQVAGSDGQPVCTTNTTKRRANGWLIEKSSEATAGPC